MKWQNVKEIDMKWVDVSEEETRDRVGGEEYYSY